MPVIKIIITGSDKSKLREVPKDEKIKYISKKLFKNTNKDFIGYQAVNESLQWLRKTLSGMVKMPRMIVYENKLEMDNPQPSH